MRAARRLGRPNLVAYFHGRIVIIAASNLRRSNPTFGTFSSPTKDGRLIAGITGAMGVKPVYGSPEHGGPRALIAILRLLRQQPDLMMTVPVDGGSPPGPSQTRITLLAEKSGGWILPIALSARPSLTLNTWDRLMLPAPFATTHMICGRPIYLPPGCGNGGHRLLQQRLVHLQRDCDRLARVPQVDLVAPPRRKNNDEWPNTMGRRPAATAPWLSSCPRNSRPHVPPCGASPPQAGVQPTLLSATKSRWQKHHAFESPREINDATAVRAAGAWVSRYQ